MKWKKRTCVICGREFIPVTSDQKTCGGVCARRRKSAMARERYHTQAAQEGRVTRRYKIPGKMGEPNPKLAVSITQCPHCGSMLEINRHERVCEVCGACLQNPIEGIDTPPANAVKYKELILPPDAVQRLLEIREHIGLPE